MTVSFRPSLTTGRRPAPTTGRPALTAARPALTAAAIPTGRWSPDRSASGPSGPGPVAVDLASALPRPDLPSLELRYPDRVTCTFGTAGGDDPCATRGVAPELRVAVLAGAGTARLGSTVHDLVELHLHTAAEHVLDGVRHPLELHLVHRADDGALLVVALLLHAGHTVTAIDRVLARLPRDDARAVGLPDLNLADLVPADPTVLRHDGAAADPFADTVSWNVLPTSSAVSAGTVARLQELFPAGPAGPAGPAVPVTVDLDLVPGGAGDRLLTGT